jgi:hypothetical protein
MREKSVTMVWRFNQIRQSSDSQPKLLRVAFARKPSPVRIPMVFFAEEAADL